MTANEATPEIVAAFVRRRPSERPGLVFRPVDGISASTVAVAWPAAEEADSAVRDFVACCVNVIAKD